MAERRWISRICRRTTPGPSQGRFRHPTTRTRWQIRVHRQQDGRPARAFRGRPEVRKQQPEPYRPRRPRTGLCARASHRGRSMGEVRGGPPNLLAHHASEREPPGPYPARTELPHFRRLQAEIRPHGHPW